MYISVTQFSTNSICFLLPLSQDLLVSVYNLAFGVGGGELESLFALAIASIKPHYWTTPDDSSPVAQRPCSIGVTKIHNNRQIVMTLDHGVSNKSETNEVAKRMGMDFYGAGRGISHQIPAEEGYAWPVTLTVDRDWHAICLAIPLVARVELKGFLLKGVTGKDVLNHAIEFVGSEQTLEWLKIEDRLTIANMTAKWGALSCIFPMDNVLKDWMLQKASTHAQRLINSSHPCLVSKEIEEFFTLNALSAGPDAWYARSLIIDLSTLSPHVAGPNFVKISTPLTEIEEKKVAIQKSYLVSSTNSRASDIAAAAEEFYITAALTLEEEAGTIAGNWETLINAGAKGLPVVCGPCIGFGTSLLKDGEVGISANNWNLKALAYLASPRLIAASAMKGFIAGPGTYTGSSSAVSISSLPSPAPSSTQSSNAQEVETEILPGFLPLIERKNHFLQRRQHQHRPDYPGKYSFQDRISREQIAQVCMENYDSSFPTILKSSDVLATGLNCGCGSHQRSIKLVRLRENFPKTLARRMG
ncbi:hypothetical protein B9Z19DRAFT_1146480 [Tuber borchii]|uniref:Aconitase/3-isopropylmalate dehydratase large subunit alpha/beta/alpha domain-containing protein n=1 Tax=Tuber borchii TaxID=42251 RepID=A0A2T6ZP41_TUBBO|nr:hypothetical protein B9Z19DRAFT_1146480 [Tuber borchii]